MKEKFWEEIKNEFEPDGLTAVAEDVSICAGRVYGGQGKRA